MFIDYKRNQQLALGFGTEELAIALTVLRFIFTFTKSDVVWKVMCAIQYDLQPKQLKTIEYNHICEKCCMPIEKGQTEVTRDNTRTHLKCPTLKPDELRGG